MALIAHAACPECEQQVIVFPAALFGVVPDELEVQTAIPDQLRGLYDAESRLRFAVADRDGHWTCPSCDTHVALPISIDD